MAMPVAVTPMAAATTSMHKNELAAIRRHGRAEMARAAKRRGGYRRNNQGNGAQSSYRQNADVFGVHERSLQLDAALIPAIRPYAFLKGLSSH